MSTSPVSNCTGRTNKCGRPLVLAVAALLCVTVRSFAIDLGAPTSRTPYDPYLGPVWSVFGRMGGTQPDPAAVAQWVREGRAFRYSYNKSQPFVPQTPEETESSKCGDCKAKSLWLANKMGSRKVRFVIGKASLSRPINHAWLIWEGPGGWVILDATNFSRPLDPERVSRTDFVPLYSFAPSGKYAHAFAPTGGGGKNGDHL